MSKDKQLVMLTTGKVAAALGVSQRKVKKVITALNIQPDEIKRNCKYYAPMTVEKIKDAVSAN